MAFHHRLDVGAFVLLAGFLAQFFEFVLALVDHRLYFRRGRERSQGLRLGLILAVLLIHHLGELQDRRRYFFLHRLLRSGYFVFVDGAEQPERKGIVCSRRGSNGRLGARRRASIGGGRRL